MIIESWFPTLILNTTLETFSDANSLLAMRAYQMREETLVTTDWRCDTFNTQNDNRNDYYKDDKIDAKIDKLIYVTIDHVTNYSKLFDADLENYKVVCNNFWFNIAGPSNYQEYHSHPNNHFSAVYYVSAEPNAGNIVFKNIESIVESHTIPTIKSVNSIGAHKTCYYTPEPTKLLIFKSNLLHMVEKNLSEKDRISIAMNFELVKK